MNLGKSTAISSIAGFSWGSNPVSRWVRRKRERKIESHMTVYCYYVDMVATRSKKVDKKWGTLNGTVSSSHSHSHVLKIPPYVYSITFYHIDNDNIRTCNSRCLTHMPTCAVFHYISISLCTYERTKGLE